MSDLLSEIWMATQPAHQFLSAILISLITAALLAAFRPSVNLIWGSTSVNTHVFKLNKEDEPIYVATEKLFVQNTGRKAATGVELILNDIPTSYNLWQPREHSAKPLEGGGFAIRIPSLAPKELLIVDTIDISRRNLRLVAVNCPDTIAKPVDFLAQRRFGVVVTGTVVLLMFSGLVGLVYLTLTLIFGK